MVNPCLLYTSEQTAHLAAGALARVGNHKGRLDFHDRVAGHFRRREHRQGQDEAQHENTAKNPFHFNTPFLHTGPRGAAAHAPGMTGPRARDFSRANQKGSLSIPA